MSGLLELFQFIIVLVSKHFGQTKLSELSDEAKQHLETHKGEAFIEELKEQKIFYELTGLDIDRQRRLILQDTFKNVSIPFSFIKYAANALRKNETGDYEFRHRANLEKVIVRWFTVFSILFLSNLIITLKNPNVYAIFTSVILFLCFLCFSYLTLIVDRETRIAEAIIRSGFQSKYLQKDAFEKENQAQKLESSKFLVSHIKEPTKSHN